MRTMRCILIFFVFPFFAFSQTIEELKKNAEEKQNAASWNALATWYSEKTDTAACRFCAEKAYDLAEKEKNDKEIGVALMLLSDSYMYKTEWNKFIEINEQAFYHETVAGETELQLDALSNIGYAYNVTGENDKAISIFSKAIDIINQNNIESKHLGVMLINTAFSYLYKGELDSTKNYVAEALIAAEISKDTTVLIEGNNQLGIIYKREENYQKALEHYEECLRLYELSHDYRKLCIIWTNISSLYYDWGKHDKALEIGRKALNTAYEYSLEESVIGQILSALGHYLIKNELYTAALDTLKLAIPYLKERKYENYILYLALSQAFHYNEQTDSCDLYLQKAEEILAQNKHFPAVRLYKYKGTFLFNKEMYNEAIPLLENYVKEFTDNPTKIFLSDSYQIYNVLSKAYELGPKNYQQALFYKELAYEKRDSLYKEEHNSTINDFYARYETAEKELKISKLNEEKQQARYQLILTIFISLVLIVLFLTAFLYNRIKRIRKEKEALLLASRIEQKESEYKILLSETEQRILRKYLEGKESERKSLAKELHDSVGNDIVSIMMLYQNGGEQDKINLILQNTYNNIRQISHQLMPPEFKYISLIGMIENYIEILNNTTSTHYSLFVADSRIADMVEEMGEKKMKEIYYIIQESIGNIHKHAKAKSVKIKLSLKDDEIILLTISDDGCGFDTHVIKGGIGLRTMQDRCVEIKAVLAIESSIGKGTTITLTIPTGVINQVPDHQY